MAGSPVPQGKPTSQVCHPQSVPLPPEPEQLTTVRRILRWSLKVCPSARSRPLPLMKRILTCVLAGWTLAATPAPAARTPLQTTSRAVVLHYAKTVHAVYSDCLTASLALQKSIRAFLSAPSSDTLAASRACWKSARLIYVQSEVFRYYAGPVDDADGPEPLLNSWPLDELYIDAGEGGDGGIIANEKAYPDITPGLIGSLNLKEGEKNISCGWHAIEFLLWGQDKSSTGPGERPCTDYTTAPHAARRGQYLQACADLIVSQFEDLTQQWAPGKLGNYRAIFEEGYDQSVERILTGMIFLSGNELAGERLQVAWDTKEQEEEPSCFSDHTCEETIGDALGLQNIYRGTYLRPDGTSLTGPGLRDLALLIKPDLVPELDRKTEGTLAAARSIPAPFDQAILGDDDTPGRRAILKTLTAAEDQSALLRTLARALQIQIPEQAASDIAG